MFRNLRARLGIISSSRLPLYVQSLAAREDAVRFERVRFRRPVLRPKYAFAQPENARDTDNIGAGL